jgi:hypothetical protein
MTQNGNLRDGATGDRPAGAKPIEDLIRGEMSSAQSEATSAADTAKREAREFGKHVQHVAEDQADKVKEATESHLDGFADALRAASDELSKNQSGPAAEFIANAASGLEGFSRSLHGRSTGEMVETVRQFGRDNPMGFLAGSVLAGLALGRFAAASSPVEPSAARSAEPPSPPGPTGAPSSVGMAHPPLGTGGTDR